ncbi:MAG: DinB family protein [Chloroflexi bacterium]|nr:DinB family protein [Chloroflexota bacterium]
MDSIAFIADCLAQVHLRLMATCEGLSTDQLLWRPAPTANNIGFILWHLVRNEDARVTNTGKLDGDIWASESWHDKFGQPATAPDPGDRMGLRALAIPSLDVLVGYAGAVHQRTLKYLSGLTPESLDQLPDPERPDFAVSGSLRHMITHKNNHHGQIDYLRGLQDEAWDLPPGTGVVLP